MRRETLTPSFIASTKASEVSYMPMSVTTTDIEGDEKLTMGGLPQKSPNTPEFKEKMKKYKNEYKENVKHVEGFKVNANDVTCSVQFEEEHGLMWTLGDFPSACSISPVLPANGWEFEIPEDSKEFVAIMGYGRITRNCLILKNADGIYDRVAMYKDKKTAEPLAILENDVFTSWHLRCPADQDRRRKSHAQHADVKDR